MKNLDLINKLLKHKSKEQELLNEETKIFEEYFENLDSKMMVKYSELIDKQIRISKEIKELQD